MEKVSNWEIGDYILYKNNKEFRIAEITEQTEYFGLTYYKVYDFVVDKSYDEPLLFMEKYWINLGNNKELVELLWLQK